MQIHSQIHYPPVDLSNAYGLSIYLPLGGDERLDEEARKKLVEGGKGTYLEYYLDPQQLEFTKYAENWRNFVHTLIVNCKSSNLHALASGGEIHDTPRQDPLPEDEDSGFQPAIL